MENRHKWKVGDKFRLSKDAIDLYREGGGAWKHKPDMVYTVRALDGGNGWVLTDYGRISTNHLELASEEIHFLPKDDHGVSHPVPATATRTVTEYQLNGKWYAEAQLLRFEDITAPEVKALREAGFGWRSIHKILQVFKSTG